MYATTGYSNADIRIVGGGTIMHVRNHLALCAPAYGSTARRIQRICQSEYHRATSVHLTKMADPHSPYVTNDDMERLVNELVADASTKIVFWNPAICDFVGQIDTVESGKYAERLKTKNGQTTMVLSPADKLVGNIRRDRKDIFLVAFKTTTGASKDQMYLAGLGLMKGSHVNLVLVNDTVTRMNMVVTPEEARYFVTTDRDEALHGLVDTALLRSTCTFTRSTVVDHPGIAWNSGDIADNLRTVINHCIERGAYQPFDSKRHGKVTVGHFAARGTDGKIITSRRWSNFNDLPKTGMILIEPVGDDKVIAYGGKPSVGGQSQRIIFTEHPQYDCIAHAHSPLRENHPDAITVVDQRPRECGSHQCGEATSRGIVEIEDGIGAVYLDNHGFNVVFRRDVDPARVINVIERNFDLGAKTGGSVS